MTMAGASGRRAIGCFILSTASPTCAARCSTVVTTGLASVSATIGGSPTPAATMGRVDEMTVSVTTTC